MQATASSHPTGQRTTLEGVSPRLAPLLAGLGIAGLAVGLGLGLVQGDGLRYFFHAYLTSYCYFLSISLGGLFFVALGHATRAGWSVTTRRLAELIAANIPCLAILFLPILLPVLLGSGSLYIWNHPSAAGDELLRHKIAYYLNPGFFTVRTVFYFLVWGWMARFFLLRSIEQDTSADPALTKRMERFSPVALALFAFTVTFASFDWLMSLEPAWFSTIYGVYYFSGAAVAFLATIILVAMLLQSTGRMTSSITVEHYHDLGKLLFAFVFFWGYIAFSQYMLIWYANYPEETTWYLTRQSGSWKWVSLVLLFAHLLIPFCGLLSREAKRRKAILGFWAAWLLIVHWIDLYWLVAPSLNPAGVRIGLIDAACLVGIGGVYLAGLLQLAHGRSLVPLGDPRIDESLAFENS
jgi:hypothetical protein